MHEIFSPAFSNTILHFSLNYLNPVFCFVFTLHALLRLCASVLLFLLTDFTPRNDFQADLIDMRGHEH